MTILGFPTTWYRTPAQFENAVLHLLRRIHDTQTGQALFRELDRTNHQMTIIPNRERILRGQLPNAYARYVYQQEATKRGMALRKRDDPGTLELDSLGLPTFGLGTGSSTYVDFTPAMFARYCRHHKRHKSGAQPDEVLFHEMVHAAREMRGVYNPMPLGFSYDTEEEFFAILVANIYASETRRPMDLRAHHHGFEHMDIRNTDSTFLPRADMSDYSYRLVHQFVLDMPYMAHDLNRVHAPFNPIRRYYELQRGGVPPLPLREFRPYGDSGPPPPPPR